MKRFSTVAIVCVIALFAGLALAGCQSGGYTPASKEQSVPDSAFGTAGTFTVGVNAATAPLAGTTPTSQEPVGIDVDTAAYLADQMGVKLKVEDVGNDLSAALADNKHDLVLGIDESEESSGYWKSKAYLQTGVALFGTTTEESVPTVDSKPKIAAQKSSKSSWRVTNLFGDDSLEVADDLKAAFDALDKGSVKYVAADAVIGTYVAHTNGYNAKIVAMLQDPSGYCMAVSESNKDLQNAVSSAIDKLQAGGVEKVIETKWLGQSLDLSNITVIKSSSDEKKDNKKDDQKEEKKDEEKSDASA